MPTLPYSRLSFVSHPPPPPSQQLCGEVLSCTVRQFVASDDLRADWVHLAPLSAAADTLLDAVVQCLDAVAHTIPGDSPQVGARCWACLSASMRGL
jgi:hypothetical protein